MNDINQPKEKDFNLSEKMWQNPNDWSFNLDANDIKEFIKRLKEIVLLKGRRALPDIDKLAGDKLI